MRTSPICEVREVGACDRGGPADKLDADGPSRDDTFRRLGMADSIGYLLPLILAWGWIAVLPRPSVRVSRERPIPFELVDACLLVAAAGALAGLGRVRFDGPHWIWFDAHRGIALTFELTVWSLAGLLVLAWARHVGRTWMNDLDGSPDFAEATLYGGLILLLLADDFCLFAAGWAIVMLSWTNRRFVAIPLQAREAAALSLFRLVRVASIVPLVTALGLLFGEFHVSSWSEWDRWMHSTESFHDAQLATLTLTGLSMLLAVLMSAALFPWASFVVDSPLGTAERVRPVGLCGWMLPPLTLWWKRQTVAPFDATVAQLGSTLAILTMLVCGIAALRQRDAARTIRSLACAHLALALLGLMQAEETLRTAGAGHALLLLVWLVAWGAIPVWNSCDEQGRRLGRSGSAVGLATVLLYAGLDGSWSILSRASIPGGGILALLLWFVLGVGGFRTAFSQSRRLTTEESALAGTDERRRPGVWALVPVVLIAGLYVSGNGASAARAPRESFAALSWEQLFSNLEFPAATLLSAALAGVWVRTFADRELLSTPGDSAFSRLAETHFYLTDLWRGACLVPVRLAGFGIAALEGTRRDSGEVAADENRVELCDGDERTRELVLGALCAAVLIGLLLLWSR